MQLSSSQCAIREAEKNNIVCAQNTLGFVLLNSFVRHINKLINITCTFLMLFFMFKLKYWGNFMIFAILMEEGQGGRRKGNMP